MKEHNNNWCNSQKLHLGDFENRSKNIVNAKLLQYANMTLNEDCGKNI